MTHNLSKTEAKKITRHENLALEIKNIWKIITVCAYQLVISEDPSGYQELSEISVEYGFNQKFIKSVAKCNTITKVSYSTQIPSTRPLTLLDRMDFLP